MNGRGEMEGAEGELGGGGGGGGVGRRRACALLTALYCLLLMLPELEVVAGCFLHRWDESGDRSWRGDGASPPGPVGGFITPGAAVLYISQGKKKKKCHETYWRHL